MPLAAFAWNLIPRALGTRLSSHLPEATFRTRSAPLPILLPSRLTAPGNSLYLMGLLCELLVTGASPVLPHCVPRVRSSTERVVSPQVVDEEADRAQTRPGSGLAVFLPCLNVSIFMPLYHCFPQQTHLCFFLNPTNHCHWTCVLWTHSSSSIWKLESQCFAPHTSLPGRVVWEWVFQQALQAEVGRPRHPCRVKPCSGHGLPSTFQKCSLRLCTPGRINAFPGLGNHRGISPPALSCSCLRLTAAASPSLCPPAGPCLDTAGGQ